jgi:hypothetical protein
MSAKGSASCPPDSDAFSACIAKTAPSEWPASRAVHTSPLRLNVNTIHWYAGWLDERKRTSRVSDKNGSGLS